MERVIEQQKALADKTPPSSYSFTLHFIKQRIVYWYQGSMTSVQKFLLKFLDFFYYMNVCLDVFCLPCDPRGWKKVWDSPGTEAIGSYLGTMWVLVTKCKSSQYSFHWPTSEPTVYKCLTVSADSLIPTKSTCKL